MSENGEQQPESLGQPAHDGSLSDVAVMAVVASLQEQQRLRGKRKAVGESHADVDRPEQHREHPAGRVPGSAFTTVVATNSGTANSRGNLRSSSPSSSNDGSSENGHPSSSSSSSSSDTWGSRDSDKLLYVKSILAQYVSALGGGSSGGTSAGGEDDGSASDDAHHAGRYVVTSSGGSSGNNQEESNSTVHDGTSSTLSSGSDEGRSDNNNNNGGNTRERNHRRLAEKMVTEGSSNWSQTSSSWNGSATNKAPIWSKESAAATLAALIHHTSSTSATGGEVARVMTHSGVTTTKGKTKPKRDQSDGGNSSASSDDGHTSSSRIPMSTTTTEGSTYSRGSDGGGVNVVDTTGTPLLLRPTKVCKTNENQDTSSGGPTVMVGPVGVSRTSDEQGETSISSSNDGASTADSDAREKALQGKHVTEITLPLSTPTSTTGKDENAKIPCNSPNSQSSKGGTGGSAEDDIKTGAGGGGKAHDGGCHGMAGRKKTSSLSSSSRGHGASASSSSGSDDGGGSSSPRPSTSEEVTSSSSNKAGHAHMSNSYWSTNEAKGRKHDQSGTGDRSAAAKAARKTSGTAESSNSSSDDGTSIDSEEGGAHEASYNKQRAKHGKSGSGHAAAKAARKTSGTTEMTSNSSSNDDTSSGSEDGGISSPTRTSSIEDAKPAAHKTSHWPKHKGGGGDSKASISATTGVATNTLSIAKVGSGSGEPNGESNSKAVSGSEDGGTSSPTRSSPLEDAKPAAHKTSHWPKHNGEASLSATTAVATKTLFVAQLGSGESVPKGGSKSKAVSGLQAVAATVAKAYAGHHKPPSSMVPKKSPASALGKRKCPPSSTISGPGLVIPAPPNMVMNRPIANNSSSFDITYEPIPADETKEEKKRRMNRVTAKKKRARQKIEVEVLNEQYDELKTYNSKLHAENEHLEKMMTLALQVVEQHGGENPPAPSQAPPQHASPVQQRPIFQAAPQSQVQQQQPKPLVVQPQRQQQHVYQRQQLPQPQVPHPQLWPQIQQQVPLQDPQQQRRELPLLLPKQAAPQQQPQQVQYQQPMQPPPAQQQLFGQLLSKLQQAQPQALQQQGYSQVPHQLQIQAPQQQQLLAPAPQLQHQQMPQQQVPQQQQFQAVQSSQQYTRNTSVAAVTSGGDFVQQNAVLQEELARTKQGLARQQQLLKALLSGVNAANPEMANQIQQALGQVADDTTAHTSNQNPPGQVQNYFQNQQGSPQRTTLPPPIPQQQAPPIRLEEQQYQNQPPNSLNPAQILLAANPELAAQVTQLLQSGQLTPAHAQQLLLAAANTSEGNVKTQATQVANSSAAGSMGNGNGQQGQQFMLNNGSSNATGNTSATGNVTYGMNNSNSVNAMHNNQAQVNANCGGMNNFPQLLNSDVARQAQQLLSSSVNWGNGSSNNNDQDQNRIGFANSASPRRQAQMLAEQIVRAAGATNVAQLLQILGLDSQH